MRRLPVYLLLDTSGSMSGERLEQVKNGVHMLVSALRQDPYALETAYLCAITFDTDAKMVVPLTDLAAFQPPVLSARGSTNLGAGLYLAAESASKDVAKSTAQIKGDWKPMVFIMTDGKPDKGWDAGLARFNMEKWGIVVGCAVDGGDTAVLKQVTPNVVQLDTANTASMSAFFKWVSASISSNSKSVETQGKEVKGLDELPPPPPEIHVV
jgi:uncharacterized protein YegL